MFPSWRTARAYFSRTMKIPGTRLPTIFLPENSPDVAVWKLLLPGMVAVPIPAVYTVCALEPTPYRTAIS